MNTANIKTSISWPILEKACELECLSFVDVAFAELMLRDCKKACELTAAFLCHLSRSVREGHLCIQKTDRGLFPCPKELWFSEIQDEDVSDIDLLLSQLAQEEVSLPENLVTVIGNQWDTFPTTPLVQYKDLTYFQKYWLFETTFFSSMQRLSQQRPTVSLDVEEQAKKMLDSDLLNAEQAAAIINACKNSFTMICGGPGTGKTYTAGQLIKVLLNSLSQKEKDNFKILLAAPTGKAANNLQKSLLRSDPSANINAQTLHSLLNVRISHKVDHRPQKKLNGDLVIVDESSMIDVRLMSYLFDSIKPGARLIMLGDPHQLPPVEVGSVFNDVAKTFDSHVCELKTCIRAELKEIVDFSSMVKTGDVTGMHEHLKSSPNSAVTFFTLQDSENPRKTLESIVGYSLEHIPKPFIKDNTDTSQLLESFNTFRILSPLSEGLFGVKHLNQLIHQKRVSQVKWDEVFVSPIMIVANDHKMELFNGETGLLIRKKTTSSHLHEGDYALFQGERRIPALLLPKFEHAYCLSVHKSQGSEFDHVLLLLPDGSERFGREVLYTAVTRTKKRLEICGRPTILDKTASNPSHRLSGISQFNLLNLNN